MMYGIWSSLDPSGSIPNSREGSTMGVIDNNLYIFGGFSSDIFSDLKVLDINHMKWRIINDPYHTP
jgi:N-acetylneuraminic acid mutarotase